MKRIIALMLLIALLLCFCSCNMSMGPGSYNYEHIHVSNGANDAFCATVEKWYDNETGIEVKTKEYGNIYVSEGLYILIPEANKCPFCN